MHEADTSRTRRQALLDDGSDLLVFARRAVSWASEHGCDTVVWHFATRDGVNQLSRSPGLRAISRTLYRKGAVTTRTGMRLVLATDRNPVGTSSGSPVAVWWASDRRLLRLDSVHLPMIDAYVSSPWRAPLWLTAFNVDVGQPVGIQDPASGIAGIPSEVLSILVSDELQQTVRDYSSAMNLVNGIHDSNADGFLQAVQAVVRNGEGTPEAVAVAALRAGWWPENVADLFKKLTGRALR